eukprot:3931787-Rhodomonas_salina.5
MMSTVCVFEGSNLKVNRSSEVAAKHKSCLKFFSGVVPGVERSELEGLAEAAWHEDASCCLALLFRLGHVKHQRKNFYRAMLWLWKQHPATLLENADQIEEVECLLDILVFVMHEKGKGRRLYGLEETWPDKGGKTGMSTRSEASAYSQFVKQSSSWGLRIASEDLGERLEEGADGTGNATANAQRLYSRVAQVFADGLAREMEAHKVGASFSGRFALGAPTGRRMHDRATHIVQAIASRLFPDERGSRGSAKVKYQRMLSELRQMARMQESKSEQRMGRSGKAQAEFFCFNCGWTGHRKAACTEKMRQTMALEGGPRADFDFKKRAAASIVGYSDEYHATLLSGPEPGPTLLSKTSQSCNTSWADQCSSESDSDSDDRDSLPDRGSHSAEQD